jgi:hypothetical protein
METKVFNDNERNTLKSTNTSNVRENNIFAFCCTECEKNFMLDKLEIHFQNGCSCFYFLAHFADKHKQHRSKLILRIFVLLSIILMFCHLRMQSW